MVRWSPYIDTVNIWNGRLKASNVRATVSEDPTLATVKQYAGSLDLANDLGNFEVNLFWNYAGSYSISSGQSLTISN